MLLNQKLRVLVNAFVIAFIVIVLLFTGGCGAGTTAEDEKTRDNSTKEQVTYTIASSVQAKIVRLLLNLQEQRGLSMLFITHDLALARKVSDTIIVMQLGKIVETGLTNEVFTTPKHAYTKNLIYAAPDLNDYLAVIPSNA